MAAKKQTKKTKARAAKKGASKKDARGIRYSASEREAAVDLLRREDPTTVAEKTGFTVDSLRRWGRAAGVTLIDGRRARAAGGSGNPVPRTLRAASRKSSLPEPVVVLSVEGLTPYIDARIDERVEAKVQELFRKMKVQASG